MPPEIISLKLSKNNSNAMKEILTALSEFEDGDELVSVFFLTSKEDDSFQVASVSSRVLSVEAQDAMADSILFTLNHLSGGKGEITDE